MISVLETWRDIVGYEGLYQVSDFGDVRSMNYHRTGQVRILKSRKNGRGYLQVDLYKDGKVKKHYIHRLVAQAFIPNPYNLPEVNHKDEDKTSNVVTNLEYCTTKYNLNYGTRNQRIAKSRSEKILQLTLDYIFVKEWESTMECGRNGFSSGNISQCCNGKRKTHKGYRWVKKKDYEKLLVA